MTGAENPFGELMHDYVVECLPMAEQVDTNMLVPNAKETWEQRWGPVATPLLWSHAMLLTLALELGLAETVRDYLRCIHRAAAR